MSFEKQQFHWLPVTNFFPLFYCVLLGIMLLLFAIMLLVKSRRDNLPALKQNLFVYQFREFSHPFSQTSIQVTLPQQASLQSFSSLWVFLLSYLRCESTVHNYSILMQLTSEKPVKLNTWKANRQKSYVRQGTRGTNMNNSHLCISFIHLFWYIFLSTIARRQQKKEHAKNPLMLCVSESKCSSSCRYNYSWQLRKYYTDESRIEYRHYTSSSIVNWLKKESVPLISLWTCFWVCRQKYMITSPLRSLQTLHYVDKKWN